MWYSRFRKKQNYKATDNTILIQKITKRINTTIILVGGDKGADVSVSLKGEININIKIMYIKYPNIKTENRNFAKIRGYFGRRVHKKIYVYSCYSR